MHTALAAGRLPDGDDLGRTPDVDLHFPFQLMSSKPLQVCCGKLRRKMRTALAAGRLRDGYNVCRAPDVENYLLSLNHITTDHLI